MKKNYFFLSALGISAFLLSFSWKNNEDLMTYYKLSHKNQNGSPGGRTGAPGDGNCTACHSGSVQANNGFNTVTFEDGNGTVTSYIPGETYTVTITANTANVKNGFEIVALNPSNTMAGTIAITDATNTKSISSGGKTRVTHKLAGTALSTWSFNWTAPATNVGLVTFYLATNETNSNTGTGGDVIRLSQHTIGSTVGVEENTAVADVSLGYSAAGNGLTVSINSKQTGTASINIVDLNGKSVQFEELGQVSEGKNGFAVLLKNQLPAGMYVANISVNNHFITKKFNITK